MIMCASCCLHSVVRLGPVGEVTGDSRDDMLKSLLGKCYFKYRCKYTKQLCTGSSIMKNFLLNKRKPKSALRVLGLYQRVEAVFTGSYSDQQGWWGRW